MKNEDPNLKPQYRMPRVFGPLPGPRNVPKDKQNLPNNQTNLVIAVTALTEATQLEALLPPDCALDGEPLVTMTMTLMSNIGWLAGRGYTILNVGFRIAHHSKSQGRLVGHFTPVCWENLADPIMTGREELGFSKIYADMPAPVIIGDSYSGSAGWLGFRFFEMEASDLEEAPLSASAGPEGSFHYKFVPRTAALGTADAEYLEYAPRSTISGNMRLVRKLAGKGRFRFHTARWEDVPFQYPIINALAALPVKEYRGATVSHLQATGSIGDPSAGNLAPID
jgi:Acetoacetate decarboxylase (ADC)